MRAHRPRRRTCGTLEYPLDAFAGQTVVLLVKISYGGKVAALNEEAFLDEISVVPAQ